MRLFILILIGCIFFSCKESKVKSNNKIKELIPKEIIQNGLEQQFIESKYLFYKLNYSCNCRQVKKSVLQDTLSTLLIKEPLQFFDHHIDQNGQLTISFTFKNDDNIIFYDDCFPIYAIIFDSLESNKPSKIEYKDGIEMDINDYVKFHQNFDENEFKSFISENKYRINPWFKEELVKRGELN